MDNSFNPQKNLPLAREAFRAELCRLIAIPQKDIDQLNAIAKPSIWPSPNTQQGIILHLLALNCGEFVGLDKLMRAAHAGAVHSTVSSLRKRGWMIENRYGQTIVRNGIKCRRSEYRLNLEGGEI